MTIFFQKLHEKALTPERHSEGAFGYDLAPLYSETIAPGQTLLLETGIALELPTAVMAVVLARTSTARRGLYVASCPIDSDYRGDIRIIVTNIGQVPVEIVAGKRLASLVFMVALTPPLIEAASLSTTKRANGAFGSTGE